MLPDIVYDMEFQIFWTTLESQNSPPWICTAIFYEYFTNGVDIATTSIYVNSSIMGLSFSK